MVASGSILAPLPLPLPPTLNGRRAGQVPRLAEAQTAWPRTLVPAQPPTSVPAPSQTLFFFFFFLQSYLFTLISCFKNVNKITQRTKAGIDSAQSQPLPST